MFQHHGNVFVSIDDKSYMTLYLARLMAARAPVVDAVVAHGRHECREHDAQQLLPAVLPIPGLGGEQLTGNGHEPPHGASAALRIPAVQIRFQLQAAVRTGV